MEANERDEMLKKAGVDINSIDDSAKVNLETLQKSMKESPTLTTEIERLYKEGIKTNFQKFYETIMTNDTLFPSLGFDKREMIYQAFNDFMKDVFPDKIRRDA